MKVAIKICANNDEYGNPQRGWLVFEVGLISCETHAKYWVEEGYKGIAALREKFPHVAELTEINVSVKEYKEYKNSANNT